MAALSSKPNHVRSISFPGRSHPTTGRVEEELTKLKSLEVLAAPKADTVYNGLLGLEKLYKCIDDLLNLPQTLSRSVDGKWVDDLLDKSLRLLDVCGTTRELFQQEDQEEYQKICLNFETSGSRDCRTSLARCRSRYNSCD